MIELKKVTKWYTSESFTRTKALDSVDLSFPRGQIVGLFGENGAGKTTMMKCILNLLKYKGDITLDGGPITRENIEKISFATNEHSFFPGLTAQGPGTFTRTTFPVSGKSGLTD